VRSSDGRSFKRRGALTDRPSYDSVGEHEMSIIMTGGREKVRQEYRVERVGWTVKSSRR